MDATIDNQARKIILGLYEKERAGSNQIEFGIARDKEEGLIFKIVKSTHLSHS